MEQDIFFKKAMKSWASWDQLKTKGGEGHRRIVGTSTVIGREVCKVCFRNSLRERDTK